MIAEGDHNTLRSSKSSTERGRFLSFQFHRAPQSVSPLHRWWGEEKGLSHRSLLAVGTFLQRELKVPLEWMNQRAVSRFCTFQRFFLLMPFFISCEKNVNEKKTRGFVWKQHHLCVFCFLKRLCEFQRVHVSFPLSLSLSRSFGALRFASSLCDGFFPRFHAERDAPPCSEFPGNLPWRSSGGKTRAQGGEEQASGFPPLTGASKGIPNKERKVKISERGVFRVGSPF